jgi:hypothetical protein
MDISTLMLKVTELITRDSGIREQKTRVNINGGWYKVFEGGGNAHIGFKEMVVCISDEIVTVTMDTDPDVRYDCFRPNPYYTKVVLPRDKEDLIMSVIQKLLDRSNNLTWRIKTIPPCELVNCVLT